MSDIKEPTTLERLQHFRPEQFEATGIRYISELIHNAAEELEAAEDKLSELEYRHEILKTLHEDVCNTLPDSSEKAIDALILEEQSQS